MKSILGAALVAAFAFAAPAFAHDKVSGSEGCSADRSVSRNISNNWKGFLQASDIGTIHNDDQSSGTGGSGSGEVVKPRSNWQYMKDSWRQFGHEIGFSRR